MHPKIGSKVSTCDFRHLQTHPSKKQTNHRIAMNWLTIMKLQKSTKNIKNYSNSNNIKEVQYDPAPKGEFDFQLSLLPCPNVETSFWKSRVQPTFWMALGCTAEPKSKYPDAIWVEMVELLGGIWQKWINGMVCYWNTTRMGMFYDSKI